MMKCYKLLFFVGLLAILTASGRAQNGTAELRGTVTDTKGAVVVGVHVTVTSLEQGSNRTIDTNAQGAYQFPLLSPGKYSLVAAKDGFQASQERNLDLLVDQAATVDIRLGIGPVTQSVTVNATGELLDTTHAALGLTVSEKGITELPLNGRNPANLVFLAPGVTNVVDNGYPAGYRQALLTFPTETGGSASGGRMGSTYYLLDGTPNIDDYELLSAPFPNSDATREFKVITNNFQAQYGFSPGAVVTIATKSGSNEFHGNAFEFLRNNALNASDYFSHKKDALKRNQFGGSLGGPILKDRLFFFGNYQRTTEHLTSNSNATVVPTSANLQGDFSALLAKGIQLKDPVTGLPVPGDKFDPARFSSAALTISKVLPTALAGPDGTVNFPGAPNQDTYNEFTVRGDYHPSEKQSLTARTFIDSYSTPGSDGRGNTLAAASSILHKYENYALTHTIVLTPHLINTATGSYNWLHSDTTPKQPGPDGKPLCYSDLINVAELPGLPCTVYGLSVTGGFKFGQDYNVLRRHEWSGTEALSWNVGKHLLTFGADVRRGHWDLGTNYSAIPNINFSGQATGNGIADFLLGQVTKFTQGSGEFQRIDGWIPAFYAQDEFKISSTVSLNYGLRWEPYLPPTAASGRLEAFRPGQQSTRYPNAPLGLVFPGDKGVGDGAAPNNLLNLDPRLGIAWHPSQLPHTSIRAAFGIFTAPIPYSSYNHSADTAPFSPTFSFTRQSGTIGNISFQDPWASFAPTGGKSPFPPFAGPGSVPASNVAFTTPAAVQSTFSSNFKLGRVQSWNLSVQQELPGDMLSTIAYVGQQSYHLQTVLDLNPGVYADGGARSKYTNFSNILEMEPIGTASYHSLQASLEKRLKHGIQFQANYTFSKTLDLSPLGTTAFEPSLPNPFQIRSNYGRSDLDRRHLFNLNFIYVSPSLSKYNPLVRAALGSWQISSIYRFESGQPFSVNGGNGDDNSQSHVGSDLADVTGLPREVKSGSKSHWLNQYFNPAAFTQNAPGTFGNSGVNSLTGVPINTADVALVKNWSYKERYGAQFRWEMFNAFNHPSYGLPDTEITDPTAGQITSTGVVPARVMQAAIKLSF